MKEHILVVDDEEIVRTGLAENLQQGGFRVTPAADAREALRILGSTGVDLVLCDLVLEGMDGMELLRAVRSRYPDLPFIMITGYGSMDSAIEALRLGASDYVQKPVRSEEIAHRVRAVLDTVNLRRNIVFERRRAEERRRELYDRLVRAERMVSLGALADGMAYELNNILGPVVSYPELLLENLPPESPLRRYIVEIREAGRRAARIVHDLQVIGRGGETPADPTNINDVVNDYLESEEFRQVQQEHPQVVIEVDLAGELPDIAGSAPSLQRVIGNLVVNAVESIEGGGRVRIVTEARHIEQPIGYYERGVAGDYVVLRVEDTGRGMGREEMEKVFEPFYSRKRHGGGWSSGLGLTLVYRVVKDHNGYIDVSSREGEGSRFLIYFPVLHGAGERRDRGMMDYSGNELIMVVDDYEEQRKVAAALLESLGYEVVTANNGRVAVKEFEERRASGRPLPDLVVLDMVLADDFDGLETFKRILEVRPRQKAVIVSGFAETARIVQARRLGAGRYVQKPYSLESLGKAVREELDEER